ncbi:MAG: Stp1/IreP family PP2C-type Ser/Thr phosphatase [Myxococcales bacterium FL481]|nr:MAG: Stp1/IreP family PP2C-type Ser/Thr phosphatase [Myxococcales bacterium FL481]
MSISFLVSNLRVRLAGKTDVGRVRGHNEDDFRIADTMALGVVSDGMGGHACGEVASEIAVTTITEYFQRSDEEEPSTWPFRMPAHATERNAMTLAIKLANSKIFETAQAEPDKHGMGCTVDAIFFAKGRCYIGHVGDSRVYLMRHGHLKQLTEDHSLLNDYRRMKEMSGEEVASFPHKNVVVRALGLTEHVAVDVLVEQIELGDTYLLCSDGLTDMIGDHEILDILARNPQVDSACAELIEAANRAGGVDNITTLLASVEEP